MKFLVTMEFGPDKEKIKTIHPTHRQYLRQFLENGQLFAAGPFADDAGATWVLEAESTEAVDEVVKGDPYFAVGIIISWKVRTLAYWSAQAARGSK